MMNMTEKAVETQQQFKIPEGFLLGAAASAHQVEGNNMNSDWWYWEKQGKLPKSGNACDHYNRYEEDFQIAKNIGLNAFRISIEWARIEPVENQWDKTAIEHYRKVLKKMKELGLVRMVTLHHFTLPQWLAEKGGFETNKGVQAFARYAWFVAQNLGDEMDLICTINEPEVYTVGGYGTGKWPPFKKNYFKVIQVYRNLVKAHIAAYKAIKEVRPNSQIGLAKNNNYYETNNKFNPLEKLVAGIAKYFGNDWFMNRVSRYQDWVGLNYYFTKTIKIGLSGVGLANSPARPKSDMGWQTFPEAIYHLLLDLKKYNKPIYITENGIANARDDMRKDFIKQHLYWTMKARNEGADVKGYFYWSLTDNYEWQDGFDRLFGLVEINYETQERKVRPSAEVFKEILNA
ncbi:MAG TPA: glycoside hydrolase family 1 protein [Candidatus Binatia bacterium]|nr:glycoside hydrolase family 1 protein [Candidatus Binatia bacterium]